MDEATNKKGEIEMEDILDEIEKALLEGPLDEDKLNSQLDKIERAYTLIEDLDEY